MFTIQANTMENIEVVKLETKNFPFGELKSCTNEQHIRNSKFYKTTVILKHENRSFCNNF